MKISIRWSTPYENYVKNLTVLVLGWLCSIFRKNDLKISPTCKNISHQMYLGMTACSCIPVISIWICKKRFFVFYSCNWDFVINPLTVKETVNSEFSDPWKQYLYLGQCKLYLNSTLPNMHWFNFAGSYFFFKPLVWGLYLVGARLWEVSQSSKTSGLVLFFLPAESESWPQTAFCLN